MKTFLFAGCFLAMGIVAPPLHSQDFTFTTIAGGSQGSADGIGTSAQFYNPTGVAVDAAGNVYVADQQNNLIRKISPSGADWIVTTLAGGAPGSLDGASNNAQFFGPTGIAVDKSGDLFVADQYNSVIRRITVSGGNWVVSTIAGTAGVSGNIDGANGGARLSNPTGVAADGSGNIFVSDEGNNAIRKITPAGTNWIVTTIAGGTQGNLDGTNTSAQFFGPSGVAVDTSGRVFVADQFNNSIRMVTPAGANWVVTTIAGQTVSGRANGMGASAGFDAPMGVSVDPNDNVYVADLFNNAIRELVPSGADWMVSTLGGGSQGTNNGTGPNASFNLPFGVAADAYGDVFVADSQNNAIRLGISSSSPPPAGALEVMITLAGANSAQAEWQLDGGPLHTNKAIVSGLVPGDHTINFSKVAGFTTPADQVVPVTARQTTLVAGYYPVAIPKAGSLQVLISPSGSVNAGAQWRVDIGAWQTNEGVVAGLSVGSHTLSFNTLSGWTTPSGQTVSITNSQTTLATGSYVLQTGSLQVTIFPAPVSIAGAKWRVDGGTFQAGGATLSGLLPGSHTVDFNTVLGWITPASQIVTITNALATFATATYTQEGTLPVTNQPPQLAAMTPAGGKFQFVLTGSVQSSYVIQASSDLARWTSISTNTIPAGGSVIITVPNLIGNSDGFYRAASSAQ